MLMRILSARIHRARRDREAGRVLAVVALTVLRDGTAIRALVPVAVAARPAGAAPLRDRLLGAAKLSLAAEREAWERARAA